MAHFLPFLEGQWYGSLDEANVALARENLVGLPWSYKPNGGPMPRAGEEVTLSLEGGVDLIARVDDVNAEEATGTIVDARKTPRAIDWDEDGEPTAWDS